MVKVSLLVPPVPVKVTLSSVLLSICSAFCSSMSVTMPVALKSMPLVIPVAKLPLLVISMAVAKARSASALSTTIPLSNPFVFAELACWINKPRVVPAEADGVPTRPSMLTVPARSLVTSRFSVPCKFQVWSAVQVKAKSWLTRTASLLSCRPLPVVISSASPLAARPLPAKADSEMSNVIVSGLSAPVIVRFDPVTSNCTVSVAVSAVGSVPEGVSRMVKLLLLAPPAAAQVPPVTMPPFTTWFCKNWPPLQVVLAPALPATL